MTTTKPTGIITAPQSRRQFLKTSAGLGFSAAGIALLGACVTPAVAPNSSRETLETTKLRLQQTSSICYAPLYVAEDFLKAEGFTDITYKNTVFSIGAVLNADVDVALYFSALFLTGLEQGQPLLNLSGVHVGCFELFANDTVHTILDLKDKTIAISAIGGPDHLFVSSMAAYVGLDPNKDINWATCQGKACSLSEASERFIAGKVDAVLAFPPVAQELRAKKIGQVVVNSMMDKPWSQYFCCMIVANRDFVKKNPVATKKVVRSVLKAADVCALQPDKAARFIVDKGYTKNYDYALETMQEIPYNVWRTYNPEDTLRFYALRLHEAGMVKASPDDLIAKGTDWHFLNEIKKESW